MLRLQISYYFSEKFLASPAVARFRPQDLQLIDSSDSSPGQVFLFGVKFLFIDFPASVALTQNFQRRI